MKAQSKCSEKIRVGVIGCGPITLNAHADALAKVLLGSAGIAYSAER